MSKDAQPGESSTASPGCASAAGITTASSIDETRLTGRRPEKAASTSSAASPRATTARTWSAPSARTLRLNELVRPTGDQNDRLHPGQRGQHGRRCGRLRVVVVTHPTRLSDQLDPMGEPREM